MVKPWHIMVHMNYQWMITVNQYLKKHTKISIPMAVVLLWITKLFYISFGLQIIWMTMVQPLKGMLLAILSAIGFVLLTIIRDKINAPRPYEVFNIQPVMPKDTKGHSFPSRHTFSAVLISGNWWILYMLQPSKLGMIILILHGLTTVYIMISRVLLTLHFPKDILAGLFSGLLWVILEYTILFMV